MIAAATGTYRIPDAGVAKHLTWRKAILGGGLAFGTLVAIVIGYTLMRTMGIGSIGTLQAKGLIKERQPILLAEFENRTPDSTLAPTLTDAFRVDLSQSQSVKIMDGEAVSDALRRMQKPENAAMTVELARQLAQREGVPAVVVGEIDRGGEELCALREGALRVERLRAHGASGDRGERFRVDPGARSVVARIARADRRVAREHSN